MIMQLRFLELLKHFHNPLNTLPIRFFSLSLSMDPYEQRLRDEVLYLHSLWHQGPPINPNPNPNPNSNPNFNHNPSRHLLQPSNPTNFKKQQKRTRGSRGRGGKKNLNPLEFDLSQVSGIEWPCKSPSETPPATTASGWPKLNLNPTPATRLPSAEEKSRFAATQLQQKGLKMVQEFFTGNVDSDEDMEDDDDDDEDDDECDEYKFFLKVFMEDTDLRGYYEKNFGGGDFCCLVCGGIGEKIGKRFKDCIALVQHSIAIAKTKKMRAHRAFGQVICKVLGWDINRLPTSVLSSGDPLSISAVKPGELQGNADGGTENPDVMNKNSGLENVNNGALAPNEVFDVCAKEELETGSVVEIPNDVTPDLMVCENSLVVADSNKDLEGLDQGNSLVTTDSNECTEGLDQGVSSIVDGNTEGVVNKLCRNLSRRMVLEKN